MKEESGEQTSKLENIPVNFMEKWVAEELDKIDEFEEKAVAEVMKWLEEEITKPCSKARLPISEDFSFTVEGEKRIYYYQTPMSVTINGNEESCGPSFSDAKSTVMASVDTRGIPGSGLSYFIGVPSTGPWYGGSNVVVDKSPPSVAGSNESFASMDDRYYDDDEWLARVLSAPTIEIDESGVVSKN